MGCNCVLEHQDALATFAIANVPGILIFCQALAFFDLKEYVCPEVKNLVR
jgi:hypothetical protein